MLLTLFLITSLFSFLLGLLMFYYKLALKNEIIAKKDERIEQLENEYYDLLRSL